MPEVFFLGATKTRDKKTGVLLLPGANQVDDADASLLLLRSDVIDQDAPDAGDDAQEE